MICCATSESGCDSSAASSSNRSRRVASFFQGDSSLSSAACGRLWWSLATQTTSALHRGQPIGQLRRVVLDGRRGHRPEVLVDDALTGVERAAGGSLDGLDDGHAPGWERDATAGPADQREPAPRLGFVMRDEYLVTAGEMDDGGLQVGVEALGVERAAGVECGGHSRPSQ